MHFYKNIFWALAAAVLFTACNIDETFFGVTDQKLILTFQVDGQIGSSVIDTTDFTIDLYLPLGTDLSEVAPAVITTSSLSTVQPQPGEVQDFNEEVLYVVTAEDGSTQGWRVNIGLRSVNETQPINADFSDWYTASYGSVIVTRYQQIGTSVDVDNFWITPNEGSKRAFKNENNIPFTKSDGPAVSLTTIDVSSVDGLPPIAAGSLYSGDFNYGSNLIPDPYQLPVFGKPFTDQPIGFEVDYRYYPGGGKKYYGIDGDKTLPANDEDAADIYVMLRFNDGQTIQRVATGWFRTADRSFNPASDNVDTGWERIQIPIYYGDHEELPDYAQPKTSLYASLNESGYAPEGTEPNEIVVVFSPSANGNDFAGVIDSRLDVANFELLY
ncbi:PCMD domain-containing protein [Persicobacter sp. CCB-QB2]|uniref:PCMD domain-containing protein n=1 Tax=Persicobacter sp. CCB-QB2 TaxID=1561025 RepID=UPI0006A9C8E9|nr:PCMD domain-containing protein [Persicobacter sp. CCB-QB2]